MFFFKYLGFCQDVVILSPFYLFLEQIYISVCWIRKQDILTDMLKFVLFYNFEEKGIANLQKSVYTVMLYIRRSDLLLIPRFMYMKQITKSIENNKNIKLKIFKHIIRQYFKLFHNRVHFRNYLLFLIFLIGNLPKFYFTYQVFRGFL